MKLGDLKLAQTKVFDNTFYCCFGFEDHHPDDLHCTHKFFGPLDKHNVDRIIDILDNYFDKNPFEPFTVRFDREKFFGLNHDVRVLLPTTGTSITSFMPDLKSKLDPFKSDIYPYNPHVTTPLADIEMPFTRYVFLQNRKIFREYK